MLSKKNICLYAIGLSYAGLLAMLARTFLDYQYVYNEMGFSVITSGFATLINLAMFGGWIYALHAAAVRFSRGAMVANMVFNALLLVFALSTVITLCPSPCPTGWPVGEIIIWANIIIGIPAVILSGFAVLRPPSVKETNLSSPAAV
jgi:hypothetical protein